MALRVHFHINWRSTAIQPLKIAMVSFPTQFGHAYGASTRGRVTLMGTDTRTMAKAVDDVGTQPIPSTGSGADRHVLAGARRLRQRGVRGDDHQQRRLGYGERSEERRVGKECSAAS